MKAKKSSKKKRVVVSKAQREAEAEYERILNEGDRVAKEQDTIDRVAIEEFMEEDAFGPSLRRGIIGALVFLFWPLVAVIAVRVKMKGC